jgi:RimJ/RimL family protein N-acetyltransferase
MALASRIFETDRLILRTWTEQDFATLHAILSDPVTMSHWPAPLAAEAVRAWLERSWADMQERGYARWCCALRDTDTVIGDVGIVRTELEGEWINDLGYIIHHLYWRQGYAVEAARGAVEWARQQGLSSLVANMATDNAPSVAVAEKLGMQRKFTFNKANNANKPTYWYELALHG